MTDTHLDTDIDIDTSWIKEYTRIHSIQQIMNREEIDCIVMQTIYMNTNLEITKIDKETIKLHTHHNTTNKVYISKEQLLQIVQTKKVIEKIKYKLFDMLLFTVDLDPTDIQKYVNGGCSEIVQLKSIPIIDDIIIPPSLFIFHSLHTFFLFFTEIVQNPGGLLMALVNKESDIQNTQDKEHQSMCLDIKSILKTSQNDDKKPRQTKKVRISEGSNVVLPGQIHKKTKKIWQNSITNIPEK